MSSISSTTPSTPQPPGTVLDAGHLDQMEKTMRAEYRGAEIAGLGHHAPHRRVANAEIEARLGLSLGWIEGRTGIRERRWAADGEALTDLAVEAGRMALDQAQSRGAAGRATVALTILATSTPDHLLPPSAPLLAHRLGLPNSGAIDMAGACAGFLYALTFADAFVKTQRAPVLVVAANILSRRINFGDRGSAILFADAAGAVLLQPTDRPGAGILGVSLASAGAGYDLIKIPAGGSRQPFKGGMASDETLMVITDGKAVFTEAVGMMARTAREALGRADASIGAIDRWIPHQANTRIIEATRRQLGIAPDRLATTVAEFGNSSAASIPFTWSRDEASRDIGRGRRILLTAAGAGLTGGSVVWGT